MSQKLFVIGVGPGAAEQLTFAAAEKLREVPCVVVAPRHRHLVEDPDGRKNIILLDNFKAALDQLECELKKNDANDAAVVVSGDPGIYSLLPLLKRRFSSACDICVLPGLSSLQCLCAEIAETWSDVVILSGHGRELSVPHLLTTVERNRLTAIFCDAIHSPLWICETLSGATGGLGDRVEIVVGERLSTPDQRVTCGRPAELARVASNGNNFDVLSIVIVCNELPWSAPIARPRDEDFERGDVPMTRCEVRSAVLDQLKLTSDAVMWDIGAGTGSVSVATALACSSANSSELGEVHAVEFAPTALELLERNRANFHLHNMIIHAGRALEVMLAKKLPRPTHVFIGGSGGELEKILAHIEELGRESETKGGHSSIRVVVSAVTLDTLSSAVQILNGDAWQDLEAVQIAVSRSRPLGRSLLMAAQNPVTLLSAVTKGND